MDALKDTILIVCAACLISVFVWALDSNPADDYCVSNLNVCEVAK